MFKFRASSLIENSKVFLSTTNFNNSLNINNINPYIKNVQYAVRGPIVNRALELEKELLNGKKLPFSEVIKCNIGDCHAVGQKPLTFLRQVVAVASYPELLGNPDIPDDVKNKAKHFLDACGGWSIGSYSQSTGVDIVRNSIAKFIEKRDNIPTSLDNVFLSTGASEAIKIILFMLSTQKQGNERAGVMIPIPQYPLYSATNSEYGAYQIGYNLNEDTNWGLNREELERAISEAAPHCKPRAIVVINPGNPTGQVLTQDDIKMVIKFAHDHDLLIMADEVYQFNIYDKNSSFMSFKKAVHEMGDDISKNVQLASFMSISKGFMGECGFRSGYCELTNFPIDVRDELYKLLSARLCVSVAGQVVMEAVVNPPKPGDASYTNFEAEKAHVLQELAIKGKMVEESLNKMPGFHCNTIQGAMYAFPKLDLPRRALEEAKKRKQEPDFMYCNELLNATGVCVVPGSGFGQMKGTNHFRITILPPVNSMKVVMERIQDFHTKFMQQYK